MNSMLTPEAHLRVYRDLSSIALNLVGDWASVVEELASKKPATFQSRCSQCMKENAFSCTRNTFESPLDSAKTGGSNGTAVERQRSRWIEKKFDHVPVV